MASLVRREGRRLLGALLVTALVSVPEFAYAENPLARAGSAVGGFFLRVARRLLPSGERNDTLDRALETYAKGSYYTTFLLATQLRSTGVDWLSDEAALLRGLSAAAVDLRDEAVSSLTEVLEAPKVSPYYPVALASLLGLETRHGNRRAAAAVAERYLADFWRRPRSVHEATIKSVFLETGNLATTIEPIREIASADGTIGMEEHPTERAVYLAGQALLADKELEKAEICFETITPSSPYFAYARYALGQTLYGLKKFEEAEAVLSEVQSAMQHDSTELFLRDRASLLAAQMLHELDDDSAAIAWLAHVSRKGPFALHAAVLAAQIHADRERPALALVYLRDRSATAAEPKLLARAAALSAELHRELRDAPTAIAGLERGLEILEGYSRSLQEAASGNAEIDRLLRDLRRRHASRDRLEAWRRRNVSYAVPDLLTASFEPGWLARWATAALTRDSGEDGVPVVYYPKAYDPFNTFPPPRERSFDPPSDRVFPSLFRRSLGHALSEALSFERELRAAVESGDETHLAFFLLDGELHLAESAPATSASIDPDRIRVLGFNELILTMVEDGRARSEVLSLALRDAAPFDTGPPPREALAVAAHDQLGRWRKRHREILRQALDAEAKAVQDLRYALEFELSQTLAVQKEFEKEVLQQGTLSSVPGS